MRVDVARRVRARLPLMKMLVCSSPGGQSGAGQRNASQAEGLTDLTEGRQGEGREMGRSAQCVRLSVGR